MKKCPFCAEEIQEEAVKCRFCGEFLDRRPPPLDRPRLKWYFSTPFIVIAILSIGPFALPFVWWHPRYSILAKAILTVVTLALTVALTMLLTSLIQTLLDQLNEMLQSLQ